MNLIAQRIILFTGFYLFFTANVCAQKNHFIYIQAEGRQAFYVKTGGRLFQSSDAGYLILSQLAEGNHDLTIGFPKKEGPGQNVNCEVRDSDMGYLMKGFDDTRWGLVNLQTAQLIMAKQEEVLVPDLLFELASDSFSIILATVVNDPGILKRPISVSDKMTVAISENKGKKDSVIGKEDGISITEQKKEKLSFMVPAVKKLKQQDVIGGMDISYQDVSEGAVDTVLIFIPVKVNTVKQEGIKEEKKKEDPPQLSDSRFLDMGLPNPSLRTDTATAFTDTMSVAEKKTEARNEKCKRVATDGDFHDLLKHMTAEKDETSMVSRALKKFSSTCFTTEQIKNLGNLFLEDEGKYKLYVAAYPFVSDLASFNSLASELKEAYYVSRFKAMLRQ